jgi:glycosyltransferase involved in cell wall biosynthesis
MPNVLLEAMASSKPVVATAVDGTRELIVHGREGFLVSLDDDESLATHLGRLMDDRGLSRDMGAAGRRRVLSHHSLEANTQQHLQLYEQVLAQPARRNRSTSSGSNFNDG